MSRSLICILGDQLCHTISSLDGADMDQDVVFMVEVCEDAETVSHHKKKLALIFSAMRHFADALKDKGYRLDYLRLDDADNSGCLWDEIHNATKRHNADRVIITWPGEWQALQSLRKGADNDGIELELREDKRFFCTRADFSKWYEGTRSKAPMESFYRHMRRKTGFLMSESDKPVQGRWNFDKENRKPATKDQSFSPPISFKPDAITKDVLKIVEKTFPDNFGDLTPFQFAVTHEDAKKALKDFIDHRLAEFGTYQDAMLAEEVYLSHSGLSIYLNCGLLTPRQACDAVLNAWEDKKIPINAVEGFIRQIIGWREYIRGIYWHHMPDYIKSNALNAKRKLPDFYWSGDTNLACLANTIKQTRQHAYSHHIQRLMITGNFALLAGIKPSAVHNWYLAVYADAYEWVELPNTIGMSQYADDGLIATKPYAASANYIAKMSDFCSACHFDPKSRTGDKACPFNFLFWDFMARHRKKTEKNPRLSMLYGSWDKIKQEDKRQIRRSAKRFLDNLS